MLVSGWHEVVKSHLGTFLVYDKLIVELTARFKDIKEAEKGAVALILAYSHEQLKKKSIAAAIPGFFNKSAALERKEVSDWLKRYFEEFKARDKNLDFLLPDREDLRENILTFRYECKKEFPLVDIEFTTLDTKTFTKIKLRLTSSVNCGYEIRGADSSLLNEGILKKGFNERIVQVKKKPAGKGESFITLSLFNKYINNKKIPFKYGRILRL
jgi:hypothetical protein